MTTSENPTGLQSVIEDLKDSRYVNLGRDLLRKLKEGGYPVLAHSGSVSYDESLDRNVLMLSRAVEEGERVSRKVVHIPFVPTDSYEQQLEESYSRVSKALNKDQEEFDQIVLHYFDPLGQGL